MPKKNGRIETFKSSYSQARRINLLLAILQETHQRTDAEEAAEYSRFGYAINGEVWRTHKKYDRDNAAIIACGLKFYRIDNFEPEDLLKGIVHEDIKRRIDAHGWTYKEQVARLLSPNKAEDFDSWVFKVQKFFLNRTYDAWQIARWREIFKLPTPPSSFFINGSEVKSMKLSNQLSLGLPL